MAQVFSCEFCEISENTFSYRTPPVVASDSTSDTLVGSFLDVLFLLLAGILSELHEKPRRKD